MEKQEETAGANKSRDLILADYLICWLCWEVCLIELWLFKMQPCRKHFAWMNLLVICLQENRALKEMEGPLPLVGAEHPHAPTPGKAAMKLKAKTLALPTPLL